ncbi:TolC family protein [Shewanella kaireitica]|uniref:TolC family protein n=1 Tax=Shewanella kaireitica TaxID=212021 RepID=UPI00200DE570|nr:TolC family protein [Shewanella kaireitica]MCL1094008.1 TolC family protein [Shewanella kaireitica]
MKKTMIATVLLGYLASNAITSQVIAAETDSMAVVPSIALSTSSTGVAQFNDWLPQVISLFNALPEIQAQSARRQQALLSIQAADRAIYNPELGMNYQTNDSEASDDTYTLDISQTLDWGDKRGAATRMAQLESEILVADIMLERSQMLAERLQALASQAQAKKALLFQQQQFERAKAQLDIGHQRLEVGDISSVELQLMQLELASNAADYAIAEQVSIAADGAVLGLFGEVELPFADFLHALSAQTSQLEVSPELPALKSAYQQVLIAKVAAKQAKADSAADPTISLSAEREGEDNKVGVGVSIPLQFRNNYSDVIAVANEGITIAEQTYLAKERVLLQQQKQFALSQPRLAQRYQDWRELVLTSGGEAAKNLAQQWQTGDINTSDYLQSQRQISSSYLAGLTLESALYENWLTWMGASGQLESYLNSQLAHAPKLPS